MITVLADRNIEGQSLILLGILAKEGWTELLHIRLVTFGDVGLSFESSDREVWRFAQNNTMILLTDNRNMVGKDSLERTIREENIATALPVITIGNVNRFDEKIYRNLCADSLLNIVLNLEDYLGAGRIFIPMKQKQQLNFSHY
jgi:predicted nuclease of predicted toxin-antitoxin system